MNHRSPSHIHQAAEQDADGAPAIAGDTSDRAQHLAEFLSDNPEPGAARSIGGRQYWRDHERCVVSMRSIESLPHAELVEILTSLRDSLVLVECTSAGGLEPVIAAPMVDSLADTPANAVETITDLLKRFDLMPSKEWSPAPLPAPTGPHQGTACFRPSLVVAEADARNERNAVGGSNLWDGFTNLGEALSEGGKAWLAERSPVCPVGPGGALVPLRCLWSGVGELKPLAASDELLAVAVADDGRPVAVWAMPFTSAYRVGRAQFDWNQAEDYILDQFHEAMRQSAKHGAVRVCSFAVTGQRTDAFDHD